MLPDPRIVYSPSTIVNLRCECTGSSSCVTAIIRGSASCPTAWATRRGRKYEIRSCPREGRVASTSSTSCESLSLSFLYRRTSDRTHHDVVVPAVTSCSKSIMFRLVTIVTSTPLVTASRRAITTGSQVRFGVWIYIDRRAWSKRSSTAMLSGVGGGLRVFCHGKGRKWGLRWNCDGKTSVGRDSVVVGMVA